MRIKKYRAATMKEALLAIKQELGDEALILKTTHLPRKMFAGTTQATIEVTAAIDDGTDAPVKPDLFPALDVQTATERSTVYSPTGKPSEVPLTYARPRNLLPKIDPAMPRPYEPRRVSLKDEELPQQPPPSSLPVVNSAPEPLVEKLHVKEIHRELFEMKKLLASILATGESNAGGGFAGPWAVLYKRLIDSEIEDVLARDLISKLKNTTPSPDREINNRFMQVLAQCFPVSGPIEPNKGRPHIVALCGPTGAGKTTTLAKLAAYYSLTEQRRVSIITADTYRIAAIDQVRTFAEIINVGLQVVFSPEDVHEALQQCRDDEIIFIDTAGRSQRNEDHMIELDTFFKAVSPDEIHLVLSSTTKTSDLTDIIRRYNKAGVNRLLFTKLDETARLGNVFNIASRSGIPISYLTSGQSVPDDIELAQPARFVQRLLAGSSL